MSQLPTVPAAGEQEEMKEQEETRVDATGDSGASLTAASHQSIPTVTYGCKRCHRDFAHEPKRWTIGGIPARTFYFCSLACLSSWLGNAAVSPAAGRGNDVQQAGDVPRAGGRIDAREYRRRTGIEVDNHHNALKCPYCNPNGYVLIDALRLKRITEELDTATQQLTLLRAQIEQEIAEWRLLSDEHQRVHGAETPLALGLKHCADRLSAILQQTETKADTRVDSRS